MGIQANRQTLNNKENDKEQEEHRRALDALLDSRPSPVVLTSKGLTPAHATPDNELCWKQIDPFMEEVRGKNISNTLAPFTDETLRARLDLIRGCEIAWLDRDKDGKFDDPDRGAPILWTEVADYYNSELYVRAYKRLAASGREV